MVARSPSRVFCELWRRGSVEEITFGDLDEKALRYSAGLRAVGVGGGDVVLVMLQHSADLFYSYVGAMMAGAIPSFMPFMNSKQNPRIFWDEHGQLFERLCPAAIVCDAGAPPDLVERYRILASEDILRAGSTVGEQRELFAAADDDVACLQHSSGTTALKKGVMLTHREVIEQVDVYSSTIGLTEDDVIVSWLPLYHDMGFIACFMTAMLTGAKLVMLDPFEWVARPWLLLDAIERSRGTFCWLPNFAFSHIANTAPAGRKWRLSSMRAFINCSEPCKPATFSNFHERFAPSGVTAKMLQVCYAMAENVFAITQTPLGRQVRSLRTSMQAGAIEVLSCGTPISGVEVRVENGEIQIRSPFLFSGYYKNPEASTDRFRDGWFKTGDLGFIDAGELFVTGRTDDLLLLNGRNFYAHELEAIINAVDGIVPGRALIFTLDDERTDAAGLVVVAECEDAAEPKTVAKAVRTALNDHAGLAVYRFDAVPKGTLIKSTSGKISRSKSKQRYLEEYARSNR